MPRRRHLYVTHSVHNTAKGIGYAQNLSAGIPDAAVATALLTAGFELVSQDADELILFNRNAEAVDLSGWKLAGSVDWTFPAGTVVDAGDIITVVRDRKAWVSAHQSELGDRVVVGNATFTGAGTLSLEPVVRDGAPIAPFAPEAAHKPGPDNWFDAQAQDFATGSDVTTLDPASMKGAFSSERNGAGSVESRLGIKYFDFKGEAAQGDRMVFTPTEPQVPRRRVILETTAVFPDAMVELPATADGFATLTLATCSDGTHAFCVHDGSSWRFVGHASVPAVEGASYRIKMTLNYRLAQPAITYEIRTGEGWFLLSADDGQSAFPAAKALEGLAFAGYGEVSGFSADYLIKHGFTIHVE